MKFTKVESLDAIEFEAPENSDAIVMLHGYGADYKDLAPLSGEFHFEKPRHWYFLNAPLALDQPYSYGGRMWFPIDMMALQAALASPGGRKFFNSKIPQGYLDSSALLVKILEKLKSKHPKVAVGGFSQGSMVAAHAAFSRPDLVDQLVLFSTTFIAAPLWEELITIKPSFPIFQSHGSADPVLPIDEAVRFRDFLQEHKLNVEFHPFNGGHEIPYNIIEKASEFIQERVKS